MSTELVSPSNIESAPFRFEGSVENRVNQFLQILRSEKDVRAVKQLTGLDAQKFLDSAQELLERDGAFPRQQEPELFRKACRLILKVSQITDQLPASLFVSKAAHDVRWLSQGHYSDVYSCEHHDGLDFPGRVILKRLRVFQLDPIAKHDTFKNLCREALVLRRLHHPSVLEFLGIDNKTFLDEEHDYSYSCLIFPLMEKGTLRHFRTVKGPRNIPVMKLILEIVEGLRYLHSEFVVHGDLNNDNILIDEAEHIKLADFGLNVLIGATTTVSASGESGTVGFLAPELVGIDYGTTKSTKTIATDIFAFASVCYELYRGYYPLSQSKNPPSEVVKWQLKRCLDPKAQSPWHKLARPMDNKKSSIEMPLPMWKLARRGWGISSERPTVLEIIREVQELQ